MTSLSLKIGIVVEILKEDSKLQEVKVDINGEISKAINYLVFSNKVEKNDKIILNTTAVELSLGTGGLHYVVANLNNLEKNQEKDGHIMKLRYTPFQSKMLTVEEEGSKYHEVFKKFKNLNKIPVVFAELHSMLPVLTSVYKEKNKENKIAYIMTDSAALPMEFSNSVKELKEKGLIDYTISIGNAFGGDFESVNMANALIFAKECLNVDIVVVSMGPGIVGTGTKYGYSGLDQAYHCLIAEKLGARCLLVPRVSFEDKRERHYGISHHTITLINEFVDKPLEIILNSNDEEKLKILKMQIQKYKLNEKHKFRFIKFNRTKEILDKHKLKVKTMGRNFEQDTCFFEQTAATAHYL